MENEVLKEILQQVEDAMSRVDEATMHSGNAVVYANNTKTLRELNDIRKKIIKNM